MVSSPQIGSRLARITTLLQQGQRAAAEQACQQLLAAHPREPAATHLLALIREQSGDAVEAERLLQASLALQPANPQFHFNYAHFLRRRGRLADAEQAFRRLLARVPDAVDARRGLAQTLVDLGRDEDAERECRAVVARQPDDGAAWTLLGYVLDRRDRLLEAESAYRRALALRPADALVHHNLGALLARLERAEEALPLLDRASSLGVSGVEPQLNRGRALALLYRLDEAEQSFAAAIALDPGRVDAHIDLARLRFMRGDPEFARAFLAAADARPNDLALQTSLATVLRSGGLQPLAERRLRALLASVGEVPELRTELARVLRDAGDLAAAEREAAAAATARPDDPGIAETRVAILLSLGRADDAAPLVAAQRARRPQDQTWIAYEATVARLLGGRRYGELYDYAALVRTYALEPPAGWSSIDELNVALLDALGRRHRAAVHPLDQSLRNGSQTMRNLISEPDRAIAAVLQAFERPLRRYVEAIGREASHPLRARNVGGAKIAGAWSVQLRHDGFHVNHVHPEGWISSAYYVAVPDETSDAQSRSGWLKFGENRYPVPGATPDHFVQPRAGTLVLFPSYLWHGTNPIVGTQTRTTIAFDAVPTAAARD